MFSSVYIAAIAVAEVAVASVLLSVPLTPALAVVGLVTFAVYANDKIEDVDADAISNPERAAFVRRVGDVLYVLASCAYGLAVALAVFGGPLALAVTLLPGMVWVLYATEWVPDGLFPFTRLKELIVLNSVVVALTWATTLTVLPLTYAGAPATPTAGVVFAYFFLRSFVDAELPNVGDVAGDRAIGVKTVPSVFGVRRTRHVLYAVDVLTVVVLLGAAVIGHLPAILTVALLAGLGYSLGVTSMLGRVEEVRVLEIATECEYLVVALVLVPLALAV